MASWEDGPEYAPLERPAEFAEPSVPPLDVAPPVVQMAAQAPIERPQFGDPPAPVAPLATLVAATEPVRDPHQAFEVVTDTVTDSAWGAAHWSPPSGAPVATPSPLTPILVGSAGPPVAGAPVVGLPSQEWGPPVAPHHSSFPAPGTPGWFAPPPPTVPPPAPSAEVTPRQVFLAVTPGLLITLAIGGLLYVLAPILVAVAVGLSGRVQVAQAPIRRAFRIGLGGVIFFALAGALTNPYGFSEWWRFVGIWSLVICWGLLVTVLVLAYRGLQRSRPEPRRSVWG